MNLSRFKSGCFKQQYKYKSFSPEKINHSFIWDDPSINTLLEKANIALGQLDSYTKIVPNVDIFVKMHILKEANTSSRIEGTNTEMDEALMSRENVVPEKRDDWEEVQNYVEAMNGAMSFLKDLPLSSRLIKKTHKILLQGVRGEAKLPGEYRKSQNWIGGSNLNNAFYVPPHQDEVNDLMTDLENFIHNDLIEVPHLIKIAIIHYQFETIHPFLDGNGRIGRLLITLYLVDNNLLAKPSLYLSDFFERNKGSYYDALTMVRSSSDIVHWIKFFLTAVVETAENSIATFNSILKIKEKMNGLIAEFGKRSPNAHKLINHLYVYPIVDAKKVALALSVTQKTARELLESFKKKEILVEITGFARNKQYAFDEYLKLFLD
jgi:Fic family protein